MVELSPRELERYDRQIRINGWSQEGQEKLKSSQVMIAGIGGLGCLAALYLTAAGIGTLRLVDNDRVELSNLNRQILHWEQDIGKYKVDSAKEKLASLNRDVLVETSRETISEDNVASLVEGSDVIVDGMDNLETRFVLNRASIRNNIPFIHGSIEGFNGHMMTIIPGKTPCLFCLYGDVPSKRVKFPVVGPTPAAVASLQSMEALKLITGIGKPVTNRLIVIDGAYMELREVEIKRNPRCSECGKPR
jgi:adenylyltransferase/sulfurtransferase